jgi:hypothetical protein
MNMKVIWFAIVFIVFLLLAGCLSLDAYSPLPEYPSSTQIKKETVYTGGLIDDELTTFMTKDSPEEVVDFYSWTFLKRVRWRKCDSDYDLCFYFNLGCPVGSYHIDVEETVDRTEVSILLSRTICH